MINGTNKGAGTILYFAALLWVLTEGEKRLLAHKEEPTGGVLACDSTLSPDAIRVRNRMQTQYGDYLYIVPHPNAEEIKVHRSDNTNWRRAATSEEATMWRLKKLPPFEFKFI